MDLDKMKKWLDLAKQFQQGQFWDSVFETEFTEKMMDQFSKAASSGSPNPLNVPFPPVDILKNHYEWIIIMDLPGVRKEDIDISITEYGLNVKGYANRGGYPEMSKVQGERHHGPFERSITLSEAIGSSSKISAKFDNGTIEIRIPRTNQAREKIIIE